MMPNSSAGLMPARPATLRMTTSRAALRQALQIDKAHDAMSDSQTSTNPPENFLATGLNLLKSQPSAYLLARALQQMWAKNPWHILGHSAVEAAGLMLTPIAQRSPTKLVAGAFVIGGLLYFARPWRLVSKSGVIASLLGR